MYCQHDYTCIHTEYFHFERFSIYSVNHYSDIIFAYSIMYLLYNHCSFKSNACQFIRAIVMSEIICTTIFCKKHIKIVFFEKKRIHFRITSEKSLSLCINHMHARCYMKRALAYYHCFRVVIVC